MFPHNEYILVETQRMRRDEMMETAATERSLRCMQSAHTTWLDQGLATIGRVMVQFGQRLESRGVVQLRSA